MGATFVRSIRIQVSLRFLLVCVTLLSVYLAALSAGARWQRELVARLQQAGAGVLFDYQRMGDSPDADFDPRAEPAYPPWMRRIVGEDFFRKVIYVVMIGEDVNDERLIQVQLGDTIEYLILDSTSITDAGLASITKCRQLRALSLDDTRITDAGIKQLAGLDHLEYLSLSHTAVSDEGLKQAIELPSLAELDVMETNITPRAITLCKQRFPKIKIRHD